MDKTTTIIIAIILIFIMFGMGLSLVPADFKNILKQPKSIVIGLINQLIFLPFIGFIIAVSFSIQPEIAVGLMILAACPGGAVSNLICFLAKADLALSVSLTGISSICSVITIPLIINFSLEHFIKEQTIIKLSLIEMILQIAIVIIIPIIIGMTLRKFKPNFASKADKIVRISSSFILLIIIVGVLFKEKSNFINYIQQAGLAVFILNITTIIIGFMTAKIFLLEKKQALSIAIESGIQNSALAITIAVVLLNNTSFAIAASIYTLSMYITGGIIIFLSFKAENIKK